MTEPRVWICTTEEESAAAGHELAQRLAADATVHLIGDLGAGKTFLARAIATARGANPLDVSSPSFAIVHEYPLADGPPVVHIDGYRLSASRREWLEIGIDELLRGPGLKLIEWPKDAFVEFENGHVDVRIDVDEAGVRTITLTLPDASS